MQFHRLQLNNVGPFKERTINFDPGVIGILGRNGAGKSTIINAIYAALTNDYSRFGANRADITCLYGDGDARIELEFSHNSRRVNIVRTNGRKSPAVLRCGDVELTKANDIQEYIESLLGVDIAVLREFIFKSQDEIYTVVSATEAARKDMFQRLFKLHAYEEVATLIGSQLAPLELRRSKHMVNTNFDVDLATTRETIKRVKDEITAISVDVLTDEEVAKYWEEFTGSERRAVLVETRDVCKEALDTCIAGITEDEQALQRLLHKFEDTPVPAHDSDFYREKLNSVNDCIRRLNERQTLEAQIAQARETLPEYSEGQVEILEQQLHETMTVQAQAEANQKKYKIVALNNANTCPTCFQTINKEIVAKLAVRQREANILHSNCTQRREEIDSQLTAAKKAEQKYRSVTTKIATLTERLDELPVPKITDMNGLLGKQALYKQKLDETNRLISVRTTYAAEIEQRTLRLKDARANRIATQKNYDKLVADIERLPVMTEEDQKRFKKHEVASVKLAELRGQLQQLIIMRNRLKELVATAQVDRKIYDASSAIVNKLTKMKTVLHRDNFPSALMTHRLRHIIDVTNKWLLEFNVSFTAAFDSELSIIISTASGYQQRASQLSGGQKVILAVCFWLAVASVLHTDIGFLALDEPTANLDTANRVALADAFNRLTKRINRGRQIIVVTHDEELIPCFDQIIGVD